MGCSHSSLGERGRWLRLGGSSDDGEKEGIQGVLGGCRLQPLGVRTLCMCELRGGRNELAPLDHKTWTLSTGPHDMSGIFCYGFLPVFWLYFTKFFLKKLIGLRCAKENQGEVGMGGCAPTGIRFDQGPAW